MKADVPVLSPDHTVGKLWKKMPPNVKTAFFAALAVGILTHMYMFTNKLPNHDDIGHLFGCRYGAASGRWLLPTVLGISGDYSMPWLNGLLSILFIAAAAGFTVSLLRIVKPLYCVLTAALMVTFPTVTSTFTYMFTADGYFLSLALACAAIYLAVRFKWGCIAGAAAITLSMGIYQSYFTVACLLCVGVLIIDLLDGETDVKKLVLKALRLLLTLAAGLAAYIVIVKIVSRSVPLTDYMGINDMGKLALRDLPMYISLAYGKYLKFFIIDDAGIFDLLMKCLFALCAAASVYIVIRRIVKLRMNAVRVLLLALLVILFPLAANIITVMSTSVQPHMLMIYGMCYIIVAPLALLKYAEKTDGSVAAWAVTACAVVASLEFALAANESYFKSDIAFRQACSYSNRLLTAVESAEGYAPGMPLVFVGSPADSLKYDPSPALKDPKLMGSYVLKNYLGIYDYGRLLNYYLGFQGETYLASAAKSQYFAALDAVSAMPDYPDRGSVAVIEGCVVVKTK